MCKLQTTERNLIYSNGNIFNSKFTEKQITAILKEKISKLSIHPSIQPQNIQTHGFKFSLPSKTKKMYINA